MGVVAKVREVHPSGAEARGFIGALTARLKPCPFKTTSAAGAEAPAYQPCPFKAWLVGALCVVAAMGAFGQQQQESQPQSHGQVVFSRTTDENGVTSTATGPAGAAGEGQQVKEPVATDAEREAVTFTRFDMDVHLNLAAQGIAVRAQVTLRNDGKTALKHLPLQISSTLNWEQIRLNGRDVKFEVVTLNSDADHTGQLHEATVALDVPLAPGKTAELDVRYSGTIAEDARRLLAIGTPEELARHSDWDAIGTEFTGLRGFGNVVWYPTASVPVILGDGARLFDEMGEHKLRMAPAEFHLRLTAEFPSGQAPTVAVINGHESALAVTGGNEEIPGVATAEWSSVALGFEAPSLFLAVRKPAPAKNTTIWTRAEDAANVDAWTQAATTVTPFLETWLGKTPRAQLTILDLPDADDAPFETGAMLATAVKPLANAAVEGILAHALTHAWVMSPRAWLSEGVAHFMGTLWLERTVGRARALESLESERRALALAEPGSPGMSAGQPLAEAISPIYYREKATYVLWMLRDVAGDEALSAALRAYDPVADANKTDGAGDFRKVLEKAGLRADLGWFFADWVDADKGLPDLTIAKVTPVAAQAGTTLVGVTITNTGYAAAEIPVTVMTANTSVTQRVLAPARGSVTPRILIEGTPTEVRVNDGTVPEVGVSLHAITLAGGFSSSQQTTPQ